MGDTSAAAGEGSSRHDEKRHFFIESLGGRRYTLTVGCGVVCSALLYFGKLTPEVFRDIIIATVAVYIGGNTFQKVKAP
jgi:hypothetical protein